MNWFLRLRDHMGEYANVKPRQLYAVLKWLGNNKPVDVVVGGKHPIKVISSKTGQSYPLPVGHGFVNKHIVKHFMEWLVINEICTKEEFDRHI
jgi:hypothetical protein